MKRLVRATLTTLAVVLEHMAFASVSLAEHETRDINLKESGINLWLFGAAIATTIVALVAFAAVMLWWERRDDTGEAQEIRSSTR